MRLAALGFCGAVAFAHIVTACAAAPRPWSGEQPPEKAVESGCAVVFHGAWAAATDGTRTLSVVADNVSPGVIEFELPDRCPNGPMDFEGLTPGFDYYGTCAMGACPGPRAPLEVHLQPGERRQVASVALQVAGSSCTSAIAPGYYAVRPVLPPMSATACLDVPGLDLRSAPPPHRLAVPVPPRRPPPPAPPVRSPPAAVDPAYACTTAGDCVLSCPNPAGCCGWSCGCTHAIRRDHADAFAANYAKTCTRPPACPPVDCAYQMPFGATCQNGRCAAATSARPATAPP